MTPNTRPLSGSFGSVTPDESAGSPAAVEADDSEEDTTEEASDDSTDNEPPSTGDDSEDEPQNTADEAVEPETESATAVEAGPATLPADDTKEDDAATPTEAVTTEPHSRSRGVVLSTSDDHLSVGQSSEPTSLEVSIIIPVFDEQDNIDPLHDAICVAMQGSTKCCM